MPHITLRHSNNLPDCNFVPLFKKVHALLVDNLGVKLSSCSSMVIPHTQYLIGDGDNRNAFIHLEIKVKPNINKLQLVPTADAALGMIKNHMTNYDGFNIKISVDFLEVTEYFRN